jgi:hypothetical protein
MPLQPTATDNGAQEEINAFPSPETLDKLSGNDDDRDIPVNPRDAIFETMEAKIEEQRLAEMGEYETGVRDDELDGGAPVIEPGLNEQEAMHPAAEPDNGLPAELKNDALAEFIVMDGEDAMFRTKVDGEERLIPLSTAKAQLQKHVAAEIRLSQAAKERKDLDAREELIQRNEATLNARIQASEASPPSVTPDVSDQDLQVEAQQVVKTLFTGDENEAVESLTALLAKTRQAPGPQVNSQELVAEAVATTRRELAAERAQEAEVQTEKDITAGYGDFSKDYPSIVADAALFRYADGMTDAIAEEHPDWAPGKVMATAGQRTLAWVESLKGPKPAVDPGLENDRHNRKRKLTPMPASHSAVQERQVEEAEETPQSILEATRAARGQ